MLSPDRAAYGRRDHLLDQGCDVDVGRIHLLGGEGEHRVAVEERVRRSDRLVQGDANGDLSIRVRDAAGQPIGTVRLSLALEKPF